MEQAQRIILYLALFVVAFFLWQSWNKYASHLDVTNSTVTHQQVHTSSKHSSQQTISQFANAPVVKSSVKTTAKAPTTESKIVKAVPASQLIHVKTDVLDVAIDKRGGNIVSLKLLDYPVSLAQKNKPFTLLTSDPEKYYIAESALISKMGPDLHGALAEYTTQSKNYSLTGNQLQVNLVWQSKSGLKIIKTYVFEKGSYLVKVNYKVINNSDKVWEGNFYMQLTRKKVKEKSDHLFQIHPYFGAAISSPEKRYNEISYKDLKESPITQSTADGWAAMVQRYFVSAWIPNPKQTFQYYSKIANNDIYTVGMYSPTLTVQPGQTKTVGSEFYSGPEITSILRNIAPGLEQTVSYGWLWFLAIIVFWCMNKIYFVVGNWGWSIIIVTVLIKLIFYPLSAKSYKSMARMRSLQPKITALRERFADDKQKQSQAMMELYKKEKVNPVGGCLPILVQIPVFFALYMVLIESVQLRQAPWILWIHDLSVPDPYFILPVLMGITMFIQQKLNPAPADPTQAKIMMFLPVIFTVLFAYFPAGLVLYWVVNNVLSVLQQWYITKQVEKDAKKNKFKSQKKK